jgi:hypothetical protein
MISHEGRSWWPGNQLKKIDLIDDRLEPDVLSGAKNARQNQARPS